MKQSFGDKWHSQVQLGNEGREGIAGETPMLRRVALPRPIALRALRMTWRVTNAARAQMRASMIMVAGGAEDVGREAGFEAAEGIMPPK